MKKMRVLHIIKTLDLGGAETNLLNLAEALDSTRVETFVAYSSGGALEERFKKAGVKLFKFSEKDHKIKSFATFGIIRKLSRFIHQEKIDIVHTHTFSAHIWGGLAAKLSGVRLLEHVHDFRYFEPEEFIRRRGMNKQFKFVHYLKNFSDRVVVLTQKNIEFIAQHHLYLPARVRELHNGIFLPKQCAKDAAMAEAWREKLGIAPGSFVILTVARLSPEKNVDLIVRIAPQVIAENSQAVFVIAGDGPLLSFFQDQVQDKGLSRNIRFVGFVDDVRGLLNLADVFLLPSFMELHSIAVLEAMSVGAAIVISRDVGCHNEFITDRQNGVLLDPFSDEGWASALIWLMRDPQARKDMGRSAFKTCQERFDIHGTARRFEEIYAELA
ncbi:MAG: glycosyltransferase family 4 protein [Candidatus Omnitrophica bacterium]|nr:glycosyltransferase family 4 protein [Candidatus Omnitrophota bacterium]